MDRHNYLSWKSQFEDVLEIHGLDKVVKDEARPEKKLTDGSMNPAYSRNKLVLSWIKATSSSSIKTLLIPCATAYEAWTLFEKRLSPFSKTHVQPSHLTETPMINNKFHITCSTLPTTIPIKDVVEIATGTPISNVAGIQFVSTPIDLFPTTVAPPLPLQIIVRHFFQFHHLSHLSNSRKSASVAIDKATLLTSAQNMEILLTWPSPTL
ncbi:unnamed protein product [Prunus armeniaca]|uniref:Retrotransposon Copia-like N-terminal domain-containing protein n=1 Tax=Prunus armeniaca TaxID=36596 RepID=A0A6J5V264_PRUAR|nr:unnamed protein product [Prunus armeniaca]